MRNILPTAYSQLPQLLANRHIKISDLQKRLQAAGVKINHKSLYRLTSSAPIHKIDTRIIGAICQTFSVRIQDVIAFEEPRQKLQKLTAANQKRLEALMSRNNEGKLEVEDIQELDELTSKAHQIAMTNARMLVAQKQSLKTPSGTRTTRASKVATENRKRKNQIEL
jgi:DNA-binding Xre family transcriptional regulator